MGAMEILRTPEDRFRALPGFPFEPRYVEVPAPDGTLLRMAYVDEGPRGGAPVLLLHGEPTWSFLYRNVVPVLVRAGLRVVAPDLVGFGRSDKPVRREDYTYQRQVNWTRAFADRLGLGLQLELRHDRSRTFCEQGHRRRSQAAAKSQARTGHVLPPGRPHRRS